MPCRPLNTPAVNEDRLLELDLDLLDRFPAPLSILYFRELDIVQHRFWKFYEPEGFDVKPAVLAKKQDLIPQAYRRYDAYLAKILSALDEDVTVILISDHGMETSADYPPIIVLRTNRLLDKLDLLTYRKLPMVDKAKSKAMSATVNLDEPVVVYATKPAYVDDIATALQSLRMDEEPIFLLDETKGRRLTFHLSEHARQTHGSFMFAGHELVLGDFINEKKINVSGQHKRPLPGIIVVNGRSARPGVQLSDASVYDIAPTVMALLGLPQNENFEGRVLLEALTEDAIAPAQKLAPMSYRRRSASPDAALTEQQTEQTKEELQGLGYLP